MKRGTLLKNVKRISLALLFDLKTSEKLNVEIHGFKLHPPSCPLQGVIKTVVFALQIQCGALSGVPGGFDSHALPPFFFELQNDA
jgi:hypothetical protein